VGAKSLYNVVMGVENSALKSEGGKEDYYKVPIDLYRDEEIVEIDLYLYYQGQYILCKTKGVKWTTEDDARMKNFGAVTFFVKFKSPADHSQFLDEKLKNLLERPNVSVDRKASVLFDVSEPILSKVYASPKAAETMKNAQGYVKNCIKFMNEKGSLGEMVKLANRNLNEHTHALHVSAYSIALAKRMGAQSYEDIFALGMGALLHDVGKSDIDAKILKKPGELDDNEWMVIRQHPEFGYNILEQRPEVPKVSRRIVMEHHERINGRGYPKGIKNIHHFSKVVGIADVFNALTCETEYSKPMSPYDALKFMVTHLSLEFDKNLLAGFIEMLSE